MENSEMLKGSKLFNWFLNEGVKEGQYAGGLDIKNGIYYCVAEFRGKPVFGYLKTDYFSGTLVLHKMTYVKYNSFANSAAENGDWIYFTSLNNGIVLKNSENTMYFHWNKLVNVMISQAKKTSPIKWDVKFQSEDGQDNIVITDKVITFGDVDYAPSEFKRDYDLRRAAWSKYEKEFGKPN